MFILSVVESNAWADETTRSAPPSAGYLKIGSIFVP